MVHKRTFILAGIPLLFSITTLLACKRDSGDSASGSGAPPLITKPLGSLVKEDFNPLCTQLGWSSSGLTFSDSSKFSSIMQSCAKEDPSGTDSPDGKKRARLTIAWFKTDDVPGKLKDLDDKGAAYAVDGPHIFTAYLHTKSKPDAQAILVKVLGSEGAGKVTSQPGPGAGPVAPPATTKGTVSGSVAAASTADGSAERPFAAGDAIDIQYSGEWWKGEVKAVKPGPLYHVHYVGWDASWDEWVRPTRVRPRTANARTK